LVEVDKTFKERLVDFTFHCRERQFVVSPQQTLEAFEISKMGYALDRQLFQHSLKTIYCKRKEQFDRFDELFDHFWSRFYEEKLEGRKFQIKAQDQKKEADSIIFLGAKFNKPQSQKEEKETKQTKGANSTIRLRQKK